MQKLETYQREFSDIARLSAQNKGIIGGGFVAWAMMIVGVIVTGTMTYSLTREGMQSNSLWREFVNVAAALPVVLLEGSALALAYGRHHWFRSHDQRRIADIANWCIWLSLASTSVVHFAFGRSGNATVKVVMGVYASYVLPLAIVAVPMLWKKLYGLSPDSAMRAAVLDAEASLRSELVQIQREQNVLIVASIRDAMNTKQVAQARASLFEQASIEHARGIVGFIQPAPDQPQAATSHDSQPHQGYVNGLAYEPDARPKPTRANALNAASRVDTVVTASKPVNVTSRANRAKHAGSTTKTAKLIVKASQQSDGQSWSVFGDNEPRRKGESRTYFRVRVADAGFRVGLVYSEAGQRHEPYVCYLSAKEWQHAQAGTFGAFVRLLETKIEERRGSGDTDASKLDALASRLAASIQQQ